MEKKEIIERLAKKYPELGLENIEFIVDRFFRTLAQKLKEHNRIEIRNFGVFRLKELEDREVYNPYTNQFQKVEGKKLPAFKCSKSLHKISA